MLRQFEIHHDEAFVLLHSTRGESKRALLVCENTIWDIVRPSKCMIGGCEEIDKYSRVILSFLDDDYVKMLYRISAAETCEV